ncbi:hypothetical protein GCM10011487_44680 [Steroidobacter agaridevorans]|uniref:Uncharacterized protein n=1 Tax=Steroidobacter agaridevorans TaxID=2695856 RepID=A0A829YI18_9GAMM|nr:hypothetical protein [Steroidobacter agaridevorans]GFE82468.1 hypothetical protein GCM10011487_44680 [Steroidobacter agaridevorans]
MTDNGGCKPLQAATNSSILQIFETAELIEGCRAHASSMAELADATCKGLSGGYQYEEGEPHLHECCGLVCRVLQRTESVLSALGVVSLEEPRSTSIGAGCADQEQWLSASAHTVRAMISILRSVEPNDHPQVLPALGDLEGGIWTLVEGLKAIAERESRA